MSIQAAGPAVARAVFNAMHRSQPDEVAVCSTTEDVVEAIKHARQHDLRVAVRGGGHSVAGLSAIEGGLLIDLAGMNGVEVDTERKLAKVGGGALLRELDSATQAHGLATPVGVVSDTGVAGVTLGGGYGWLRRKYGLSSDNIVEAEVVTADGSVLRAAADENPDLYWAIRGGGGNFGIVTSFTFKLHEVGPEVAFAATFYPIEQAAEVMRRWRSYVESAPDEVTSTCVTMTFPANPELPEAIHDRPVIIVGGVHAGADVEAGLAEMQPLRELGTALFDMSGPTPFVGVQTGFDALFPRDTLRAYWKSQYVDELTDEAIDTIAAAANDRPAPLTLVNTFHMGGAIARVGEEETAFHQRTSPYMVSIDGMWLDAADDDANIEWVRSAWNAVAEHGTGEVYLNFTGLADEAPQAGVDSAYGRNLARLAEIKAKYDPENFFRINNNVVPA
ncbi:MAG TPA: FAD-binding oxidoreductase [Thermoleophilaceae bacterium]|jgi:FAD/FMN-containing dehydrogenase|nr:FAD-binding oxidoreductase [Thermoleophilaceae bacterium]